MPPPAAPVETSARKAGAGLFPLPRGHFGHGYVSPEQADAFRELANQRVGAALAAERALVPTAGAGGAQGPPRLSVARWKRVTSKLDMHIYRRRRRGRSLKALAREEDHEDIMRAVAGGQPSMIGIGRVEGSLEDLLYGWYASTHEEAQASMALTDKHVQDSTVVATIETAATPTYVAGQDGRKKKHPMQYIGIKWLVTKMPAALILAPRDWCVLHAMGVSTDPDGRRFGYCVLHSVRFPGCPPFDVAATGVVRGELYQTFILRENAPGFVDVFSRGVYDPCGVATPKFAAYAVTGALTGISSSFRCAETKKLTLLALRNRAATAHGDHQVLDRCAVCYKRAGAVVGTMRWRQCRICCATVCSKCYAKKSIFTQRRASDASGVDDIASERETPLLRPEVVECCTTCMIAAKNMTDIRPAEPEFSIVQGAQGGALCLTPLLGQSVASSAASSSGSDFGGKPSTVSFTAGISPVDLLDTGTTMSLPDDRGISSVEEQVDDAILYTSDDFDSEMENGQDEGEDVDIDDAAEVAAMVARMEKQALERSGWRGDAKSAPRVDEHFEDAGDLRNFGSDSKSVGSGVNFSASMGVESSTSQPPRRRPRARPASASNVGASKASIDLDPAMLSATSRATPSSKANRTSSNSSSSSSGTSDNGGGGGNSAGGASGRVNHQMYLLERMVALHNKAEEVYDITRANQEMMFRSMGPK